LRHFIIKINAVNNKSELGWAISTYWLAIGAGRIIISTISGKLKTDYLFLVLALISFMGIVLFVFVPSSIVIFIAIALTGMGLSGIQPLATAKGSSILNKKNNKYFFPLL
jgi:MFS family permease